MKIYLIRGLEGVNISKFMILKLEKLKLQKIKAKVQVGGVGIVASNQLIEEKVDVITGSK